MGHFPKSLTFVLKALVCILFKNYLFMAMHRLLIAVASLAAAPKL